MAPQAGSGGREDARIHRLLGEEFVSPVFHLGLNGKTATCHAIIVGEMTNLGTSSLTGRKVRGTKLFKVFLDLLHLAYHDEYRQQADAHRA